VRGVQDPHGRSLRGLMAPEFVESWAGTFAAGQSAGVATATAPV
jgi:hypothetical protein